MNLPESGTFPPEPLNESDTRAKLIDPAIHARGWTEDLIKREETAGAIHLVEDKPRRQARGRIDYTLRIKVNPGTQPIAMVIIEAKARLSMLERFVESDKCFAG